MAKVAAEAGSTANRYQILAKLAVGGMAEIFLARGASVAGVERYCVLKRILRERASDAEFVQMFMDEARLAAQLQHPNIASVYDIGMLGNSYFFTMEYVHGETVRSLIDRAQELRRPIPLACVLTIIAGAASGLHHAHERNSNDGRPLGIVHRDVSPSNLMVSFEGNIKLVDFGVAKADDRAVETRSGTVKGKISYLSPEQCRGERVDRRSDLFSLGIVMWELLTSARLYRRESDFGNMTAIVNEPPPPPSKRRAEVPRAVDDIVLRLLAKSTADRFQTADEVVEAIENASMRAGTILSTSAVSRLVRDLFGVRAEPWLEVEEAETGTYEPVQVSPRPLSKEFDLAPLDDAEFDFDNVLDLSSSHLSLDPDDLPDPSGGSADPPAPRPSQTTVPVAAPPPASLPRATATPPAAPPRAPTPPPEPRPRAPTPTPTPSGTAAPTVLPAASSAPVAMRVAPSAPIAASTPPAARSPRTPTAPPATAAAPTAAPSSSGASETTPFPTANASLLNTTLIEAAPSSPLHATLLDVAPPSPLHATLLDPVPGQQNTTLLGVSAPPLSMSQTASAFPIPGWVPAQITPPAQGSSPSGSNPAISNLPASSSGPRAMPGASSGPIQYPPAFPGFNLARPQAPAPSPRASRVAWPLVAVIVLAAAAGVVVVWLSMRTSHGRAPEDVAVTSGAQALPAAGADISDASTMPQTVPPATVGPDPSNGPRENELSPADHAVPATTGAAIDAPVDAPINAPVNAPVDARGEALAVPGDARLSEVAASPTHAQDDPSRPTHAPTSSSGTRPPSGPSSNPSPSTSSDISLPEPTPPQPPPSNAAPPPPVRKPKPAAPTFDTLHVLYEKDEYASVVRACSGTTVTAVIANICTLAACHAHDTAKAQRWLSINPAAARDRLASFCKQLGTNIKVPGSD